jgi:Ala-tRNA(Pro) deacylase
MHTPETLYEALGELGIPFVDHKHAAVFTVAEGHGVTDHLVGAHIKNLFVKDKAKQFYLITALHERALDLKSLGKHLGSKDRLSFADEEALYEHLGVTPGSVSPLALINAKPGSLRFILDSGILGHGTVYPHPLVNTQTTALVPNDLMKAIASWGHAVETLDLGMFPRA